MAETHRYAAFVSYSSKDAAFAIRLHRSLERYVIPSSLGQFRLTSAEKPNRLYPVFRDREELRTGALGEVIEAALRESGALIVVCSPYSAASPWVAREIEYFESLGRGDRIFAILPDDVELGSGASCFPPALSGERQPLAADARKDKDGYRNAVLKVVAGLIDVNAGALQDRDRARRRQLYASGAGAALAGLLAIATVFSVLEERQTSALLNSEAARLLNEGRYMEALPLSLAAGPPRAALGFLVHGSRNHVDEFAAPVILDFGGGENHPLVDAALDGSSLIVTTSRGRSEIPLAPPFEARPAPARPEGASVFPLADPDRFVTVSADGVVASAARRPNETFQVTPIGRATSGRVLVSSRGDVVMLAEGSSPTVNAQIYVQGERRIYGLGAVNRTGGVSFSPGGHHLLVSRLGQGTSLISVDSAYSTIPLGSINIGSTLSNGWRADIQFSQDDRVVVARAPSDALVFITLSDGEMPYVIANLSSQGRWQLSPDGRWVAAWTQSDESTMNGDLFLISTAQGAVRRVLGSTTSDSPEFTPDSRYLLYEVDHQARLVSVAGAGEPVVVQQLETEDTNVYTRAEVLSDGPLLVSYSQDRFLRVHVLADGELTTRVVGRFGEDATIRPIGGTHYLGINDDPTEDLFILDVDAEHVSRNLQEICAQSGEAIRPFSELVRDRERVSRGRRPLYDRLRGRPWHPCDWRGLGSIEGWSQLLRGIGIRYFGARDYICEERGSNGQADAVSRARCVRMRSLRAIAAEEGLE